MNYWPLIGVAVVIVGFALKRNPVLVVIAAGVASALAAATDNVGRFFGEDVFLAFGAVLLIQGFYARNGIQLDPLAIALWALPTAIAAFVIHALRICWVQRTLVDRQRRKNPSHDSRDRRGSQNQPTRGDAA